MFVASQQRDAAATRSKTLPQMNADRTDLRGCFAQFAVARSPLQSSF
jgi:hypothetical protein